MLEYGKRKDMKLQEFLTFIQDEEARIELEIDEPQEKVYKYVSFWLSDHRCDAGESVSYNNYNVVGISFFLEQENSDMKIIIRP